MEKANRIDAATLMEAVSNIAEPTSSFEWNTIDATAYTNTDVNADTSNIDVTLLRAEK